LVNGVRPVASILVLSEDTGKQIHFSLVALVRKMLLLVDSRTMTQKIEYVPSDPDAREALRGKIHAGNTDRCYSHRLMLAGKIATELGKPEPIGFVVYHSDADRRWSEARGLDDFPDFVKLRAAVVARLGAPRRLRDRVIDESRIERFYLLAAYWELEAWLYQNIDVARRICRQTGCEQHMELFDRWEHSRSDLDELDNTKDSCCLTDRHNQELAEAAFPASAVDGAKASFSATVERLRNSSDLRDALRKSYETD
jgi:hypothetical protein